MVSLWVWLYAIPRIKCPDHVTINSRLIKGSDSRLTFRLTRDLSWAEETNKKRCLRDAGTLDLATFWITDHSPCNLMKFDLT